MLIFKNIPFIFIFICQINFAQQKPTLSLSDKYTLQVDNATIKSALKILEAQANISFAYAPNVISKQKRISLNLINQSLSNILDQLFLSQELQFKIVGNQIVLFKKKVIQKFVLSGYVREHKTLEALPGATIYISSLQKGTSTNDYGFFSIEVEEGNYNILFSYLGYSHKSTEFAVFKDERLSIALIPNSEHLKDIIITSSTTQKPSRTNQMSSLKIIGSQVETTPVLLGEKDLLKTIQLLPGVQSGAEGSSQIYVRGGAPDQNLTIIDEATVYNSNHLFGFLSVYNVDALKSTTLYKGAFPASYGGRLSSVLKITTKDGNKDALSGRINLGLLTSSFLLEGPIVKGKTSFLVTGRRSLPDLIAKPFQNEKDNTIGYYFYDMNLKLHHILDKKNNFYISTYFGKDAFSSRRNNSNNAIVEGLNWGNFTATARWNHQFNSKLFSNTSLIYSNYNLEASFRELFKTRASTFTAFSGVDDVSLKYTINYIPNSHHNIMAGLHNTFHHFVPERKNLTQLDASLEMTEQRMNSQESAFFLEDNMTFSKRLKSIIGVRLNHFETKQFDDFTIEPRLSLAYSFLSNYTIKASCMRMNQFVHLLTNTGAGLPTDLWVSATKNVKPQRANQYAIGLAKDFGLSGYALEAEVYSKTMYNIIAYKDGASFIDIDNLDTGRTVNWEDNITSGKGWAYGAEVLLRKQKGALQGWMGYTLSWSQRQFDDLNAGQVFFSKYDQRHNLALVGTYKPSKKITWSASWIYRSGTNFTVPELEGLSPTNTFPISSGVNFFETTTSPFATQRNNLRGEATHRLNAGIQINTQLKHGQTRTWGFSIYNIYARKNPLYYYVSDGTSSAIGIGNTDGDQSNIQKSLRRVSVLVFIPSINYSFTF